MQWLSSEYHRIVQIMFAQYWLEFDTPHFNVGGTSGTSAKSKINLADLSYLTELRSVNLLNFTYRYFLRQFDKIKSPNKLEDKTK